MNDLRKAAQQALEALEAVYGESCDAIHALRAALAADSHQPEDAYKTGYAAGYAAGYDNGDSEGFSRGTDSMVPASLAAWRAQALPLTADETMALANETAGQHWCDEAHLQRFRAAIERAHGIE